MNKDWLRAGLRAFLRFLLALAVFGGAELTSDEIGQSPGRMPLWLVLVATAVVAVAFFWTRGPLTRLADTIVLGERAGGYEAGRALLQRMSTTLAVDEIIPALAETTGRTMHSTRAEVRVLLSEGDSWSRVWPEHATPDGSPVTVGVRHAGAAVGEIEVDIADPDENDRDRMLLDDLARPAGIALSTVRLTVELRRRAAQLEDLTAALLQSNRRIADARRTEVDRIRAEMADRVMPHLDRAQSAIIGDHLDISGPSIDQARGDVGEALDALRHLARGIYPPRLDDGGLAASLEGWQQRSGVGVDVQVRGDESRLHNDPEIESCLYFTAVIALEPAGSSDTRPHVLVDIGINEVRTVLSTAIPGPNAAGVDHATQQIRDRVEAFGGRLQVENSGARRAIRTWIPLTGHDGGAR